MEENTTKRKTSKRYLNAVKLELKSNLELMQEDIAFYTKTASLSRYLGSRKEKSLEPDSLVGYNDIIGYVIGNTYKTSAFEMLKTSGAMRLIKNEVLMESILESYASLEDAISSRDTYMSKKLEELYNVLLDEADITSDNKFKESRLFRFLSIHSNVEGNFLYCSKQINEALLMLE